MGDTHPSLDITIFELAGKERGSAAFLSLGERLVLKPLFRLLTRLGLPGPSVGKDFRRCLYSTSFLLQPSYNECDVIALKNAYNIVKNMHKFYISFATVHHNSLAANSANFTNF